MASLLEDLYARKAIELGKFTLKSGQISSIYLDLRLMAQVPKTLKKAADELCQSIIESGIEFDYVIGVPYGAIPLAVLVAMKLDKQILLKRKETKDYGKKDMVTGQFEAGERALVIEDVVTTGASILETVDELKRVGLVCEHVFCVVDREQGGLGRLNNAGLQLCSLIQMQSILDFLLAQGVIDEDRKAKLIYELKNSEPPTVDWSIQARMALFPPGSLNRRLAEIMVEKQSNLCLAVDGSSKERILQIVDSVKDSICVLKLHCDTIGVQDWADRTFLNDLRKLAEEHRFLLFEDRKFGDTAKTVQTQLTSAPFRVAEWAHLVTMYPLQGSESIEALKPIIDSPNYALSGLLLIAELSTKGAKARPEDAVDVATKVGPEVASGFICQKRCHKNPGFLYWTPGVNMGYSSDGMGQCWRGPEQAVTEDGCDIVIVGRGITGADDVGAEARRYAKAAWEALSKR